MNERTMRFRLGLLVLIALLLFAGMVLLFGTLPTMFKRTTRYEIGFTDATGIVAGAPVRRSGLRIGTVTDVLLDDETGQVRVVVALDRPYKLRAYEQPTLVTGLLASDASIDLVPRTEEGKVADRTEIPPGTEVAGVRGANVGTLVNRASQLGEGAQDALDRIRKSLERFEKTAPLVEDTLKEYRNVARSINDSMPDLRKTNTEVGRLAESIRKAVPEFEQLAKAAREAVPELRQTNRDAQELIKRATEAVPEVRKAAEDFAATSRTLGRVGEQVENFIKTNRGKMDEIIENVAKTSEKLPDAVDNLDDAVRRVASVLSPENRRYIERTLKNVSDTSDRLPKMADDASEFLKDGKQSMKRINEQLGKADELISNLTKASRPLAERADGIFRSLDEGLDRINRSLGDVRELIKNVGQADGTLGRLLTDPSLYNRVDEIACAAAKLLPRVDRILKDFEVFADKLARHPETIGIGGAVRPGSGIK